MPPPARPDSPPSPEVLRALAALWSRAVRPGETAELSFRCASTLTVDFDPASGLLQRSAGGEGFASVRLWNPEGGFEAQGPFDGVGDLEALLARARRSPAPSGPPSPGAFGPATLPEGVDGALDAERARELATSWARALEPLGTCIQALLVQQTAGWSGVFHSDGSWACDPVMREQALVRCETPNGALVDGVASARLGGGLEPSAATERLRAAVEALAGAGTPLDAGLPLVLRPPVAGPLVAGLAWALRGDVAASVPGLARAVGKKLFPGVLTVRDEPTHPLGTVLRAFDDEGQRTEPVTAVRAGVLLGFLHSRRTAARLGVASNGRGLRVGREAPSPGALNLHVEPGTAALPPDRTELSARVETFTTMRQPGVVSLLAWGWEVRDGRRHRRVGPLELELPVLATFRQLVAVGSDLTFLPGSDGCGTPTLVFAPPSWLGAAGRG
ncbi:MAG TPA: metallopeptidase TldD-related protein [Longimicrobium sp.]|nr:metallopeptidase TldD-related protein [Longimicrobium sp.]